VILHGEFVEVLKPSLDIWYSSSNHVIYDMNIYSEQVHRIWNISELL